MNRSVWAAWGVMVAVVGANSIASVVWPAALWVTMPAALFAVFHYGRTIRDGAS